MVQAARAGFKAKLLHLMHPDREEALGDFSSIKLAIWNTYPCPREKCRYGLASGSFWNRDKSLRIADNATFD
jgi:hypothetical protein